MAELIGDPPHRLTRGERQTRVRVPRAAKSKRADPERLGSTPYAPPAALEVVLVNRTAVLAREHPLGCLGPAVAKRISSPRRKHVEQ